MRVQFGIIGTSTITDTFLKGAFMDSRFEFIALYSRTMERGEAFAKRYGVNQIFTNLEEFAKEIDAVYIATPNSLHAQQAQFFLERNIHVLCEKPLCSNAREAKALIKIAEERGVTFMEAMITTLNPNFLSLKEMLIKAGRLRKYSSTYCQYSSRYDNLKRGIVENAFKNELSNGALVDIGIYTIYPMVSLFGRPKSIKAIGHILNTGVDGSGVAIFEYDGLQASISYSKISNSIATTEIEGEEGTFSLEKINIPRTLSFKARGGDSENFSADHCGDDYFYEVKEFIDLIVAKKSSSSINSHQNSLIVLEIMDEIRAQIGVSYPADKI